MVFSLLHIVRDVLQDAGIRNVFSTVATKHTGSYMAFVLGKTIVNTYVVAPVEIGLSVICLLRKKFGFLGYLSMAVMTASFSAWLYYWVFL